MTTVTPGWASRYLDPIRPASSAPDPVDVLAVQQTLARYAFALDQHDQESLGSLHTADARWTFRFADTTEVGPIAGRDSIVEFVRSSQATETAQHRHHLTDVAVHSATQDEASAHAYLLLTSSGSDGAPAVVGTGFYRFRLRRTEDGWLIDDLFLGTDNGW